VFSDIHSKSFNLQESLVVGYFGNRGATVVFGAGVNVAFTGEADKGFLFFGRNI